MKKITPDQIEGLILDMDGVLWRGSELLIDLKNLFQRLNNLQIRALVATNNSTKTPDTYLRKLSNHGVQLEPWQFINSSQVTASYLALQYPRGGKVFAIGEIGLIRALQEAGFQPDKDHEDVLAVVVGMDHELTYQKINHAARLIRGGVPFFGTNPDKTFPTPSGLAPGAGVVLAALEAASGVSPLVLGKPESGLFKAALSRLGTSPTRTMMVGDRLETDIAGAQRCGIYSALVLTGVASREEASRWQPPPDLVVDSLSRILDWLEKEQS